MGGRGKGGAGERADLRAEAAAHGREATAGGGDDDEARRRRGAGQEELSVVGVSEGAEKNIPCYLGRRQLRHYVRDRAVKAYQRSRMRAHMAAGSGDHNPPLVGRPKRRPSAPA